MNSKENNIMTKYKKHEIFKNIWLWLLAFLIGFSVSQFTNNSKINTNFLKSDINNSLQIASSSVISKDSIKQEKKDLNLERIDKENLKLNLNKNLEIIEANTKKWIKIISLKVLDNQEKIWKDILNIKIKKKFETWDDFSFINISSANYQKNWKVSK